MFNTLDESGAAGGLNETIGLQGGTNNTDISWWHAGAPTPFVRIPTNGSPIDWNKDGNFTDTGVIAEINGDGQSTQLPSQNDWATTSINGVNTFTNLKFLYQCNPNFSDDLIIPRELRFGRQEPMVAAKPNFGQLFQEYWRIVARMQPHGSWASQTAVQVLGASGQVAAREKPAVDWLKERTLRLDP